MTCYALLATLPDRAPGYFLQAAYCRGTESTQNGVRTGGALYRKKGPAPRA